MSEASAAARARRPILLVDDPSWNRSEAAEALLRAGFLPLTEPGAERALALAASQARFDAVVLPAGLRDTPVEELIQRLRVRRRRVPVLVLGPGAEVPAPASPAEGPVVCLEETSDLEKLCEALRTWLGVPATAPERTARPGLPASPVGP